MQKLSEELKNAPRNTSPVPCSVNSILNKDESLSVSNTVLTDNSPEVNQSQHTEKLKVRVYVISIDGNPLMPCSPTKAKHLLKENRARVVKRIPFTIQLTFECENQVQDIILGIDTGYKNIGFSAVTSKDEIISGTVTLDTMMKKRLEERKMYRKLRRNRLWYRKPRFMNRKSKIGWLPPSTERGLQTHLNLIEKIKKLLPITNIRLEVGNFDIQKLENLDIQGKDYQEGNMYGYQNIRSYLFAREKGKCQLCKKEFSKGNNSHIHHIVPRSQNGTNRLENLALLHNSCHKKLHKQNLFLKLSKNKSYKQSTFMSIIKSRLYKILPIECFTFGYETFTKRIELGLSKTHNTDAFVIANGTNQERCKEFIVTQKRKNNRCLQTNRKGYKPSIRKQYYKCRPGDIVKWGTNCYEVVGTHSYGTAIKLKSIHGALYNKSIKVLDNYHFYQSTLKFQSQ